MCMIDYAERIQVLSERTPIARREHKCGECHRTIAVGEKYENVFGKLGGDNCRYKTCRHCLTARQWLSDQCDGWVYTGVEEDLREHFHEEREMDWKLARLIVNMGRQWRTLKGSLVVLEKQE